MSRPTCRVAVLVGLLAPLAVPAAARAQSLEVPPELQQRIDAAIDRGVRWLRRQQQPDGCFKAWHQDGGPRWEGATALCLWTLLKCGVNPGDPGIERGFEWLRTSWNQGKETGRTWTVYSACTTILALEARYHRPAKKPPKPVSPRSTEELRKILGAERVRVAGRDLAWMQELVDWLMSVRQAPAWRYPQGGLDTSNTHFVLLAFAAAQRCGVRVPVNDSALDLLQWYLEMQQKSGPVEPRYTPFEKNGKWEFYVTKGGDHARGFPYQPGDTHGYGSMTAASVVALIILKSQLDGHPKYGADLEARHNQAIYDGLAWLANHYTVTENPLHQHWHYYYLYALERVGVFFGTEYLGRHRWYVDGAQVLVDAQRKDGSWHSSHTDPDDQDPNQTISDTCWALLFLKRGTLPVAVTITPPAAVEITGGR